MRMSPIEFRAPWSKSLKVLTTFSLAVLALVTVVALSTAVPPQASFIRPLLVLVTVSVALGALPFMVRGYVLTEDAILVKRLGWMTRLPLHGLRSVSGDVDALRGAWRVFGNGGLFSFTGEFWSRRLGRFRALATDPERAVVLRWPKRTIVITPHDPQQFIMRAGTLLKTAGF
jgi:Bacterial PH domain